MSEDFTPPPRRPAPDELRQRIATDLLSARNRSSRRGRVLAPVAAALVLVAGVGGVLGTGRLNGQHELVPVDQPSPTPTISTTTPSTTPTPKPSPSAPSSVQPETLPRQAMSAAQKRRDTKSCLEVEGDNPPPRQGQLRTRYAVEQPLIANSSSPDQRVLFLEDDLGQYECVDGVQSGWHALSSSDSGATAGVAGSEVPNTGGGSSASCDVAEKSRVDSSVLLQVDEQRVDVVRVTLYSNRSAVRIVDLPVDGPTLYVGTRLSGAAARLPMSFRVELHDDQGRVLPVQPYGASGTKPAKKLTFTLYSCADQEEDQEEDQPKPLTRPRSDRAGVAACLKMVEENGEQGLDVDQAKAEVTISTPTEWGTVLSDGTHHLGCSLYPTREISASAPTSSSITTSRKLFSWATNPIVPEGESLWAAGYLPGATTITYTLPDGTTAAAKISPDGYWMVKAQTPTSFAREDNLSSWEPVRVAVTRNGRTTSYAVPWTLESMCHQISHGC